MYGSESRDSHPYGNEPRTSDPYESGSAGAGQANDRARARTPIDLRDQASRLIEAHDPEAALRAAALYLQAADRILAEAAYQFSEAKGMADQATAAHSQVDVDRRRLARELRELEQERLELAVRTRELHQALAGLGARETALQALENELTAQRKDRRRQREREDVLSLTAPDGGLTLRPDPTGARTQSEFMQHLAAFKTWSGNRSLRQISEASGGRVSPSTVGNILRSDALPDRLEVLDAIVDGCGGSHEDRTAFATAWRRLYMASTDSAITDMPLMSDESK